MEDQYACSDCGRVGRTENEIKKHIREDHVEERVRSREVCKHWRRGNCNRGNQCGFSHAGHQTLSTSAPSGNTEHKSTRKPLCHNGKDCQWNERGQCRFFHPRGRSPVHSQPEEPQRGGWTQVAHRQRAQSNRMCHYGERCDRKSTCVFRHPSSQVFQQQRPQVVKKKKSRGSNQ